MAEDMISRQATVDAIKTSRFLVDALEKVLKLPPAGPQWMPCDEVTPDEDIDMGNGVQRSDVLLVTVKKFDTDFEFIDMAYTLDGIWKRFQDNKVVPDWCEVTAWMPLPEPYTERRNDE